MERRNPVMLKRGEVVKLVRAIAETREVEIGCDACFEGMDRFAEVERSGADAGAAMPLVRDHLDKCEDCRSAFDALLAALRGS